MSNITDNPKIQVLKAGCSGIFTNYIYKAIPLAFDESMSYYETLAGLLAYLKDVILPTVNGNAEAVAELQELYIQLNDYVTNYFDNLDVQEEINNKLDKMVEDGTLESILLNYSQITKVYDTYNDMIFDTSTFINGMKLKTLGYHYINDGGGAEYIVTNTQNDNKYQISIGTNLWIELILTTSIKPEQVGIQNNVETNLMTLVSNISNNYKIPLELSNNIYLINESIPVFSNQEIIGNNGIIKSTRDIPLLFSNIPISNLNIHDLTISASTDDTHTNADGISVPCFYSKFNNINISGGYNSINITTTGATGTLVENYFSNIICRNPRHCGLFLGSADNNKVTDGFIDNIIVNGATNCAYGIYIGSSGGWKINGCHFYGDINIPLYSLNAFYTSISNIYIEKANSHSILCLRVQANLLLNNINIHQTSDTSDCIKIERSAYHPTANADTLISNVEITRNATFTSKIINCVSLNALINNINISNDQNPREYCTNCLFNVSGQTKENFITAMDNKTSIGKILLTKTKTITGTTSLEIPIPELYDYGQGLLRIKCYGGVYYDGTGKYYSADVYFGQKGSTPYIKKFNEVNEMFTDISYSLDLNTKIITLTYTFNGSNINAKAEYQVDF